MNKFAWVTLTLFVTSSSACYELEKKDLRSQQSSIELNQEEQLRISSNPDHLFFHRGGSLRMLEPDTERDADGNIFYGHYLIDKNQVRTGNQLSSGSKLQLIGKTNKPKFSNSSIPFTITDRFSESQKKSILTAIDRLNKKSNLFLYPRRDQESRYIKFMKTEDSKRCGYVNDIGPEKGMTRVFLYRDCLTESTISHELMHALGFWHMQERSDRSDFVKVHYSQMRDQGCRRQYDKVAPGFGRSFFGEFSFDSVMLYGSYACKKDKKPTMLRLNGQTVQSASRLTRTDIDAINRLYPKVSPFRYANTFECSSFSNQYKECPFKEAKTSGLIKQISGSSCKEGISWGKTATKIWVHKGCRGIFYSVQKRQNPKQVDFNSDFKVYKIFDRSELGSLLSAYAYEGYETGWKPGKPLFNSVGSNSGVDVRPIYRCRTQASHFISTDKDCEGQIAEGQIAQLAVNPDETFSQSIIRCFDGKYHSVHRINATSKNKTCGKNKNSKYERTLGFANNNSINPVNTIKSVPRAPRSLIYQLYSASRGGIQKPSLLPNENAHLGFTKSNTRSFSVPTSPEHSTNQKRLVRCNQGDSYRLYLDQCPNTSYYELPLGYVYSDKEPGTQALHQCSKATKDKTRINYLYKTSQDLYLCEKHGFQVSKKILGFVYPTALLNTIYQHYKPGLKENHLPSFHTDEGTAHGFRQSKYSEMGLLRDKKESSKSLIPIFRCHGDNNHFISRDGGCEGFGNAALLGYSFSEQQPGTNRLYRCIRNKNGHVNHLFTTKPYICKGDIQMDHSDLGFVY